MRIITIDMNSLKNSVYGSALIRQGEHLASELLISLSSEFKEYNCHLIFQLNNRTPVVTPTLIPDDHDVLHFALTNALTNEAGRLKLEIIATDENGAIMKSAGYVMEIKASIDGTNTEVMPAEYAPWYIKALEEVNAAKVLVAEFNADEIQRQANELVRQADEETRKENEVLREQTAAEARAYLDEFEANEVTRQQTAAAAESARAQTFTTKEAGRQSTFTANEATRETNETARKAAEAIRETAHAQRTSTFNSWIDPVTGLDARINNIITTPVEGVSAQEIIDARGGEATLGARVNGVELTANFSKDQFVNENTKRNPTPTLSTVKQKRPMVTFIDDDGNRAVLSKLKPISERQGVPFVIALIGQSVQTGLTVTATEALELQDGLGWEIASHSQTHLGFLDPLATPELIESELKLSVETMRAKGLDVKNFVYPGGQYDNASKLLVSKYYNSGISTDISANTPPFRLYNLGRLSYPESPPNNTLAYYKAKVDEAVSSNGWLIWMLHCGQETFDSTQEQILEELITYIKSINVDILTVQEALNSSGDIININSGQYYMTADGKNNIRDYQYELAVNDVEKFNFSTPPSFFNDFKITETLVYTNGAIATSPSLTSGYLVVHKSISSLRVNQIFYSNLSTFLRQSVDSETWTEWQRVFAGAERSVTADFGTIASMGYASRDVSVNSLAGGHYMMITPSLTTGLPKGLMVSCHVTGGWIMTITIFNPTANPIVVGSQTFKALHMKAY